MDKTLAAINVADPSTAADEEIEVAGVTAGATEQAERKEKKDKKEKKSKKSKKDEDVEMVDAEGPAAVAAGAVYVDSRYLFCSQTGYCPPFIGRNPVRVDGNHITAAVSRNAGRVIASQLRGD